MNILMYLPLISIISCVYAIPLHDSSDEYIDYINSVQSSWVAGRNFEDGTFMEDIISMMGALSSKDGSLERNDHVIDEDGVDIPDSFDARTNWPQCSDIISKIYDQSSCQSAWAVAAASAMSDRLCIHSNGTIKVEVSGGNILSCCTKCGFQCMGGWPIEAWRYWQEHGIVTGGGYNTTDGCQAYPLPPCEHYGSDNTTACTDNFNDDPVCEKICDDPSVSYDDTLSFGESNYWVYPNVSQLQLEIMYNGPVIGAFVIYSDFVNYKSGVYERVSNESYDIHVAKLFGWGTDETGTDYWIAANSWNPTWGDNGFFKILRGEDHCGIEGEVTAGMPRLDNIY